MELNKFERNTGNHLELEPDEDEEEEKKKSKKHLGLIISLFAKEDTDATKEKQIKESFFIRVLKQLRRENNEKQQEEEIIEDDTGVDDEENQIYVNNKLEQAKADLEDVAHHGRVADNWEYAADVILLTKTQQALMTTEAQQSIEDMVTQTIEETKQDLSGADNTSLETNNKPDLSEKNVAKETVPLKKVIEEVPRKRLASKRRLPSLKPKSVLLTVPEAMPTQVTATQTEALIPRPAGQEAAKRAIESVVVQSNKITNPKPLNVEVPAIAHETITENHPRPIKVRKHRLTVKSKKQYQPVNDLRVQTRETTIQINAKPAIVRTPETVNPERLNPDRQVATQNNPDTPAAHAGTVDATIPKLIIEASPVLVDTRPSDSYPRNLETVQLNSPQVPPASFNRPADTKPIPKEAGPQIADNVEPQPIPTKKPLVQSKIYVLKKVKNILKRPDTDPVITAAPTFVAAYEKPLTPPIRINNDQLPVTHTSEPKPAYQDRPGKPETQTVANNIFIAKLESRSAQKAENTTVGQLSYSELLWHAEKIIINSKSLKEIYFREKLDMKALKTIVMESLSGGNVRKVFEKELAKNKLKFPVPSLLANSFTATNIGYSDGFRPEYKPACSQSNIGLGITNRFKTKQNLESKLDLISKTPKSITSMLVISLVLILVLVIILSIAMVKHRV